jgi:hypothetical protein
MISNDGHQQAGKMQSKGVIRVMGLFKKQLWFCFQQQEIKKSKHTKACA